VTDLCDARFVLSGATAVVDPFGVWETPAPAAATGRATRLTWRVELLDAESGSRAISARAKALERGMDQLKQEDINLYAQSQALREALDNPATLESPQLSGAVAFGQPGTDAEEKERAGFQEDLKRWLSFVEQVKQMVSSPADVETVVAGQRIGLTCVDLDGDFKTFWLPGVSSLTREAHRQNVQLMLASRVALLRVISVITTGAGGLIAKALVLPPLAQAALIPELIRVIARVMDAVRAWETTQS